MEPTRDYFSNPFSLQSSESPPGSLPPWHWHDINEIYLCESDRVQYLVGKTLHELNRGDLLVLNSLDVHRALPPEQSVYKRKVILFKEDFIKNWSEDSYNLLSCFLHRPAGFKHYRHLPENDYMRFLTLYKSAEAACTSNHPAAVLQQKIALTEILIFLNEIYSGTQNIQESHETDDQRFIQKVLMYIEENLCEKISLALLSQDLGVSINTLNKRFKLTTRSTVHQYIIQRRLRQACMLLKQGKSVSESAYASGFGDLSHFIRCFKSNLGKTPRQYALDNA